MTQKIELMENNLLNDNLFSGQHFPISELKKNIEQDPDIENAIEQVNETKILEKVINNITKTTHFHDNKISSLSKNLAQGELGGARQEFTSMIFNKTGPASNIPGFQEFNHLLNDINLSTLTNKQLGVHQDFLKKIHISGRNSEQRLALNHISSRYQDEIDKRSSNKNNTPEGLLHKKLSPGMVLFVNSFEHHGSSTTHSSNDKKATQFNETIIVSKIVKGVPYIIKKSFSLYQEIPLHDYLSMNVPADIVVSDCDDSIKTPLIKSVIDTTKNNPFNTLTMEQMIGQFLPKQHKTSISHAHDLLDLKLFSFQYTTTIDAVANK